MTKCLHYVNYGVPFLKKLVLTKEKIIWKI